MGVVPFFFKDRLAGLSGQSFTQGYYEICRARGQCVSWWEAEVQHSSGGISVLEGTANPHIYYMRQV